MYRNRLSNGRQAFNSFLDMNRGKARRYFSPLSRLKSTTGRVPSSHSHAGQVLFSKQLRLFRSPKSNRNISNYSEPDQQILFSYHDNHHPSFFSSEVGRK